VAQSTSCAQGLSNVFNGLYWMLALTNVAVSKYTEVLVVSRYYGLRATERGAPGRCG
jgi:hypothetical protein